VLIHLAATAFVAFSFCVIFIYYMYQIFIEQTKKSKIPLSFTKETVAMRKVRENQEWTSFAWLSL
jgi:hypothetical protein